jgi:hypothetical protein
MTRRRTSQPGIVSRDQDATEHLLHVADHPAGLISLTDDEMIRILTPAATVALIAALLDALGSHVPARPISGSF